MGEIECVGCHSFRLTKEGAHMRLCTTFLLLALAVGWAEHVGRRAGSLDGSLGLTIHGGSNTAGNDEEDESLGELDEVVHNLGASEEADPTCTAIAASHAACQKTGKAAAATGSTLGVKTGAGAELTKRFEKIKGNAKTAFEVYQKSGKKLNDCTKLENVVSFMVPPNGLRKWCDGDAIDGLLKMVHKPFFIEKKDGFPNGRAVGTKQICKREPGTKPTDRIGDHPKYGISTATWKEAFETTDGKQSNGSKVGMFVGVKMMCCDKTQCKTRKMCSRVASSEKDRASGFDCIIL